MQRPYGLYLLGGVTIVLLTYDAVVMLQGRGDETVSVQFLEAAQQEPILAAAAGALLFHLCGGAVKATKVVQEKSIVRAAKASMSTT